jgi:UDP-N-acetylmuramoyl-L-alanyl-D-glutamate--2,6-diaminopimelate ligase
MVKLKSILNGIRYKASENISRVNVKKVTDDSRKAGTGDLFIALSGCSVDGRKFIDEAINSGAGVIMSDKKFAAKDNIIKVMVRDARSAASLAAANFYGNPSKKLRIAGVTGTNGKTTITYIMENILKAAKRPPGVIGTINYRMPGMKMPAQNTTPGPFELQALFAKMLTRGVKDVVMEVSSHSLDQGRVDHISFDVGIFTNITKEHLDYHKTVNKYFEAKAKLFHKLKKNGVAVLNNDDSMVAGLKKRVKTDFLTYGLNHRSDIMAHGIKLSEDGSIFTIKTPRGSFEAKTKLIGKHNVSNILAGAAAAIALRIPLGIIRRGVESFGVVPGRLEIIDAGQPFKVFIDYSHTEDALHNVLSALREIAPDRKIITVFGCGGNRDVSKRPLMGAVACKFSDRVIVTSDNPRFEDPSAIIAQIESGMKEKFLNYDIVEKRRDAIRRALKLAREGDVVLIAGKGHEKYQIIKGRAIPFDDRQVARSILKTIPRLLKRVVKF